MTRADRADDACVVVPAFNESSVLGVVLADLGAYFGTVVVVDDGSTDATAEIARAAGAIVVRHGVNLGQGAALQTGFDFALRRTDVEFVVTFDADGQHAAADAYRLLAHCRADGLDVVLGSRGLGGCVDQPWQRRALLRLALRFSKWSTGLELTDTHNGLRVLRRSALSRIRLHQRGMAYASELEGQISTLNLMWREAAVEVRYTDYSRAKGQQNLNAVNILLDLASARIRTS
ncbi:MAG: glycosyltransferase family 2 protein [Nocardioides sp.]|nr:glycosyltransferase family 2 protein [Nocardioides sp.]